MYIATTSNLCVTCIFRDSTSKQFFLWDPTKIHKTILVYDSKFSTTIRYFLCLENVCIYNCMNIDLFYQWNISNIVCYVLLFFRNVDFGQKRIFDVEKK